MLLLQGKRNPDPEAVNNKQLRHMCDNVLQLLTNTVEQMETVSKNNSYDSLDQINTNMSVIYGFSYLSEVGDIRGMLNLGK